MTASIATLPTIGAFVPRMSALARFDSDLGQPSPYPSGRVAIRLGQPVVNVGP